MVFQKKNLILGPSGKAENGVLEPKGLQYEPEGNKSTMPRRSRWLSRKKSSFSILGKGRKRGPIFNVQKSGQRTPNWLLTTPRAAFFAEVPTPGLDLPETCVLRVFKLVFLENWQIFQRSEIGLQGSILAFDHTPEQHFSQRFRIRG